MSAVVATSSTMASTMAHSIFEDDISIQPVRIAGTTSIEDSNNHHERLEATGERVLKSCCAILGARLSLTLFVPVRHGSDEPKLLYAALLPDEADDHDLIAAPPGHLESFLSGEPRLEDAQLLLLPVYGHDGRVCCLLELGGVHGEALASPAALTGVVRKIRAAAGHSGLLELLSTDDFVHAPRVWSAVVAALVAQNAALAGRAARRWVPDAEAAACACCGAAFSLVVRRHHCRDCLQVVCGSCSPTEAAPPAACTDSTSSSVAQASPTASDATAAAGRVPHRAKAKTQRPPAWAAFQQFFARASGKQPASALRRCVRCTQTDLQPSVLLLALPCTAAAAANAAAPFDSPLPLGYALADSLRSTPGTPSPLYVPFASPPARGPTRHAGHTPHPSKANGEVRACAASTRLLLPTQLARTPARTVA